MDVELCTVTVEVTGNVILFTSFDKSETKPYVGINHVCGDFSLLMYIISACKGDKPNHHDQLI